MSPIRSRPLALAAVGLLCLGTSKASVDARSSAVPSAAGRPITAHFAARAADAPSAGGGPTIARRFVARYAVAGPTAALQAAADSGYHEFTFTRAAYSSGWGRGRRGRGRSSWATDYPKADRQFITLIQRLVGFDIAPWDNAVRLDDPELRRYPFLYAVEVGHMAMTDAEVQGLRDYLLAGGFLVVDDFWGTYEWENFEREIRRVLPEYPIVDLPSDHPVFHEFYQVDEVLQVPNIYNAMRGGPTWERDGYVPVVRGIHDVDGRLMVLINWNTDLGDAWEWAEDPAYPLRYSSYAYELGTNMILYAMSH